MKKLLAVLFVILAGLLLCSVISSSAFTSNPWQHLDGEDFGLIGACFATATMCLVSAALKARKLNHDAINKQRILSFFYCGWQNSSYDLTRLDCNGLTIT